MRSAADRIERDMYGAGDRLTCSHRPLRPSWHGLHAAGATRGVPVRPGEAAGPAARFRPAGYPAGRSRETRTDRRGLWSGMALATAADAMRRGLPGAAPSSCRAAPPAMVLVSPCSAFRLASAISAAGRLIPALTPVSTMGLPSNRAFSRTSTSCARMTASAAVMSAGSSLSNPAESCVSTSSTTPSARAAAASDSAAM